MNKQATPRPWFAWSDVKTNTHCIGTRPISNAPGIASVPEDIAKWSGFDGNGRTPKENAANVALIVQAVNEREALRDALTFIESLAAEELAHVRVGTGAEIALRHIQRRAERALAAPSPEPPAASRLKP